MFIQNLSTQQQSQLLSLSKELVGIDGDIDEKESVMISVIEQQCDSNALVEDVNREILPSLFEDNSSKTSLFLELIGLAFSDGTYHEAEEAWLKDLAKELSVSSDVFADMHSWVERQMNLVVEAQKLMEA